jgi:methionyl-tRNA formyltransferase
MTKENHYSVAGAKPWNRRIFDEQKDHLTGLWYFCSDPDELTERLKQIKKPRFIFFFHWSWQVPSEIINNHECVCFHMADVPYGRGGSPLQNLIIRSHRTTKLTALRMVKNYDAGPVYLKEDLSLEWNAEEIYIRSTYLSFSMIQKILKQPITPVPQNGNAILFKRRTPQESKIDQLSDLQSLYDFIRMLDAEGYPKAFIEKNNFRYEFSRVGFYNGRIVADVNITPIAKEDK